jgi:hypothetical protein
MVEKSEREEKKVRRKREERRISRVKKGEREMGVGKKDSSHTNRGA